MNQVHQKIINAIIQKANQVCPNALALIGIYGSVATGDTHAKSDLDLLILINDESGYQLATGFLLDDSKIGYDIYCTTWQRLQNDASLHHAYLASLMDSEIVYIKDQASYQQLLELRDKTKQKLASDTRFEKTNDIINQAKICYANACLDNTLGAVRLHAFGVLTSLADAAMIYHGRYFQKGTKRMTEELSALPIDQTFIDAMHAIAHSCDLAELRSLCQTLLLYATTHFARPQEKHAPSEELAGTYEEMFSNWRNKVAEAAEQSDTLSSFMNLCCLQAMLNDIAGDTDIGSYAVMDAYDPNQLDRNLSLYDACLADYETVYQKANITVTRYKDVDAFVAAYLA